MVEKKTTKKETAAKAPAAKKCATKKAAVKAEIALNAENVGFRAGDVYQALAAAQAAMTVAEISKAAAICEEEVLLGIGWLLKEGKVVAADNKVTLA